MELLPLGDVVSLLGYPTGKAAVLDYPTTDYQMLIFFLVDLD